MKAFTVVLAFLVVIVGAGIADAQGTWVQVVGPNAQTASGFGDAHNTVALSSEATDQDLFIGTFNGTTGSEVWKTSDGRSWQQANVDGFGGTTPADNQGSYSMYMFVGHLYASTWGSGGPGDRYADPPTMVWRYDGTTTWPLVNTTSGFAGTNPSEPWAMEVFGGPLRTAAPLYVGVADYTDGAAVWRSTDGTVWTQANNDGFGDSNNAELGSLRYFNGYMYAGTVNFMGGGLQVWRTNVALAAGSDWTNVSPTTTATDARSMEVFNGYLYLAASSSVSALSVYRTSNGTSWSPIAQSSGGFGDSHNMYSFAMTVHDGALYLGTYNATTGGEVWRTTNGTTWTQVNSDGFGQAANYAVQTLVEFNGDLYAGVRNSSGCQVWKLTLFADGFETGSTTAWSTVVGQ